MSFLSRSGLPLNWKAAENPGKSAFKFGSTRQELEPGLFGRVISRASVMSFRLSTRVSRLRQFRMGEPRLTCESIQKFT